MDRLARLLRVLVPAHLESALHQVSVLRLAAEQLDRVGIGADSAVAVADPSRELDRLWAEAGDDDRWRLVRQVIYAGMSHAVMAAAVVVHASLPQRANHLDRLL